MEFNGIWDNIEIKTLVNITVESIKNEGYGEKTWKT